MYTAGGKPLGINSNNLFFVFYNGGIDTPWSIKAVDTSENIITDGLELNVTTSSLKTFDLLRSGAVAAYPPASWSALPNRIVSGVAFKASDFTFTGGNTVSDIAGIRFFNSNRFDVQDIGVTTVIPPPSVTIILLN